MAPTTSATPASSDDRPKPIKISADVYRRARNYVHWRLEHGDRHAALVDVLDQAVTHFLDQEAAEHRSPGQDFPERGELPRGTRFKVRGRCPPAAGTAAI